MPETRTVRDERCGLLPIRSKTAVKNNVVFAQNAPILDALIGAQGRVVYTEEDVEAAARAAWKYQTRFNPTEHRCEWEELEPTSRAVWRSSTRAAITAAGGVVADEVMEVECSSRLTDGTYDVRPVGVSGGGQWLTVGFRDGDKLYIVRAKEE